jgi:nitrite reductase/ring-hydroxylating ferredoxin subunit
MGLFARIFGICKTPHPKDSGCWIYADGKVDVALERAAELSLPGNGIRLEGKGLPQRILLFCGTDGNFYAFKNKCTHGGRRLDPVPGTEKVQCCSVFGSVFAYTGEKVSGPAKGPLTNFPVEKRENRLIIRVRSL